MTNTTKSPMTNTNSIEKQIVLRAPTGYEHIVFEMIIERMDAQTLFAYRWHPSAIEPAVDYSKEPATLVEFKLEEAEGGTRLTLVESGFDRIPAHRRAEAFRTNDQGWTEQMENIRRHVEA